MTDVQVTQFVIAVATLVTVLAGLYREARNRRWEREDRAAVTAAVEANTRLTKEAKDAAREAYHEANSVNVKIAHLQEQLVNLKTPPEPR